MFKIQSHVPIPKPRRAAGSQTALEMKWISEFVAAYRRKHSCQLVMGHFDSESRLQVLRGPTFTMVHSPRRYKEMTKALK